MRWIIQNIHQPDLYWSNEDGWGDKDSATGFSQKEYETLNCVIEGEWIEECEHIWPGLPMIRSVRSNGEVEVRRCNNCVAVQVIFEVDGNISGKVVSPD